MHRALRAEGQQQTLVYIAGILTFLITVIDKAGYLLGAFTTALRYHTSRLACTVEVFATNSIHICYAQQVRLILRTRNPQLSRLYPSCVQASFLECSVLVVVERHLSQQ